MSDINLFVTFPIIDTKVIKNKVDKTAPDPNIYISFLFILSSMIFVENTPAQNTIVKGLDKVRIKVVIKILLLLSELFKLRLGIKLILKAPKILLIPNIINTTAPNIFKYFLVFSFLSIKVPTPKIAARI